MATIARQDYEAALNCIAQLYECEDAQQFARVALQEVPRLIGSDHTTFNYLAPSVPKAIVLATYEPPDHAGRQRTFARYLDDHPVLKNYLATGDGSAHLISDFQSEREYHALPLYRHFYHDMRYEDQLACVFFPPGAELVSLALARDRRSFTERDRALLNLLHPLLARAYRHVEQIALWKRALRRDHEETPQEMPVTSILLDAENRPVQFGSRAQQWMNRFFPGSTGGSARLPEDVTAWLRRAWKTQRAPLAFARQSDTLVRERGGQRLRLRVLPALSGGRRILVLGLETAPGTAHSLRAFGLTPREIEVLLQVEVGKTNDEAAATLGISPLTVRTHLEHIFDKLHVPSRTAAVTHFRRLCSG